MAEAVLLVDCISQGPTATNNCSLCKKFKQQEDKATLMEDIAQEVLRLSSGVRNCEFPNLGGAVLLNAEILTVKLLDGYFQKYSACDESDQLTCVVFTAIKKRVSLAFPMVEGEFERNVQIWFQDRKLSVSAEKSTVAKVEEKLCSFCIFAQFQEEDYKHQAEVDKKFMLKHCPSDRSNSYKEMVDFFLTSYTLNDCPLNMESNCLGAKFEDCIVLVWLNDQCLEIFKDATNKKTNQMAQYWFEHQLRRFENLESVTIVHMGSERTHTPNVIEIMLEEEWIGDATSMINGILDAIFEKYSVGFVLACGSSMNIPSSLCKIIFGIVSKKHPQLQAASYQDCITKWFESRK